MNLPVFHKLGVLWARERAKSNEKDGEARYQASLRLKRSLVGDYFFCGGASR